MFSQTKSDDVQSQLYFQSNVKNMTACPPSCELLSCPILEAMRSLDESARIIICLRCCDAIPSTLLPNCVQWLNSKTFLETFACVLNVMNMSINDVRILKSVELDECNPPHHWPAGPRSRWFRWITRFCQSVEAVIECESWKTCPFK